MQYEACQLTKLYPRRGVCLNFLSLTPPLCVHFKVKNIMSTYRMTHILICVVVDGETCEAIEV